MEEKASREQDGLEDTATKAVELSKIVEDLLSLDQAFRSSESVFLNAARRKVFRHGDTVLKFGPDVSRCEAKTLQFVGEMSNIPVPQLYHDYMHSDGTVVIAMEHVQGEILSELWPTLRADEKMEIVRQLRGILDEMRQHRSNMIGGVHHTPAVDVRRFRYEGGPFPTEEHFNEFLRSDISPATPKIYRSMLEEAMADNHAIVLTHGDISPRNIVVNDGQIVAVLDWESAGWYPAYWEYVKFFNALDPSLDWADYAAEIFSDTYAAQYIIDSYLDRLLAH